MDRVVIVGAGLAGASTAWHLAGRRELLLLEQGEQPGAEASAQNAGMLRRLGHDRVERTLALRSAPRLITPDADWHEAPPFRRTGAVIGLLHQPAALDLGVAHLTAQGVAVRELSSPSAVAPALAGSPLKRCWYLPDEGVVDAHALLWGFLRGARRQGAQLQTRTPALRLARQGDTVIGVHTPNGLIRAEQVVLAAGAWSAQLAATVGLERPLQPMARHLLHSAPHALSQPDHPWTWLDDVGVYVRPEAGGWLCSPCDEAPAQPSEGPGSHGPIEPEGVALALDKLERWLPAVADLQVTGGWTGLRTFAPDRRPYLGADPELHGLWWAAGLGGFGVSCAFAAGETVAAAMQGHSLSWLDLQSVSPGRPQSQAILATNPVETPS